MHALALAALVIAVPPSQEAALKAHVRFLSSDALGGRGPATAGDALAQAYIATQFEAYGLVPGGADGGYLQQVELVGVNGAPASMEALGPGGKAATFKFGEELIAVAGAPEAGSRVERAEVVFVGYGIVAPEFGWDDFKGADLKGKVLLVMNSDPESDPKLFAGKARLWYGRWDYKYEMAAKLGAAGCIIIHTTPSAGYPWQVVQTSWSGEQFDLPSRGQPTMRVKAWLTDDASKKLVALSGKELDTLRLQAQRRDFRPVPLGVTVSTSFKNEVKRKVTANVLGVLPGADKKLKDEWVVFTAHHDHLGTADKPKPGEDAIYNGALDNAAGVAALLALAHDMAREKAPKRTVLFAAVAAEEQGLLGSQYLVEHFPVALGRVAANVNIDGFNIWGKTKDVSVIGLGKSSLDDDLAALAKAQGRHLVPDALTDRGFFYRSDQFNFAKAGVPAAYFGSGNDYVGRPKGWGERQREVFEAKHYHQPSDELNAGWDFSGALQDVALYGKLLRRIADAPKAPKWVKGDEFEEPRRKALEALKQKLP